MSLKTRVDKVEASLAALEPIDEQVKLLSDGEVKTCMHFLDALTQMNEREYQTRFPGNYQQLQEIFL